MPDWKYGISLAEKTPLTAPLPLEGDLYENMRRAKAYGYDAVEFHTRETYQFDFDRIERMREDGAGDICAIVSGRLYTQGGMSLLGDTPEKVQGAMDGMYQYIDSAHKLGVDVVIGWLKGQVPEKGDRDHYMSLLAQRLKVLNEYAKAQEVRLVIEVINHYETNIFTTAKETVDFLCENALDNCYIHLDTYHMGLEEYDPYEAIRLCGKRLGYFHVSDNSRRHPGSGQFDFKRILAVLKEIGYSGFVTVECLPDPDRETAAKKAISHLKACEP